MNRNSGLLRLASLAALAFFVVGTRPTAVLAQTTTPPPAPAGWNAQDIGNTALPGRSTESGGIFTVSGAGDGVGRLDYVHIGGHFDPTYTVNGYTDEFQFCYQQLHGEGEIVARYIGMTQEGSASQAGVMIRAGFDASAPNVFHHVRAYGGGTALSTRSNVPRAWTRYQDETTTRGLRAAEPPPTWFKLVRLNDGVMSYTSSDGVNWAEWLWVTIPLAADVQMGLAVSGGDDGTPPELPYLAQASFDQVRVGPVTTPVPPPQAPVNLTAVLTSTVPNRIGVTWQNPTTGFEMVEIQESTNGTDFTTVAWFAASPEQRDLSGENFLPTGTILSRDYPWSGLTYTYRARTIRGAAQSMFSNLASVTTSPEPNPPDSVTARAVSTSQVLLTWRDNSTNEVAFVVERSTDSVTFTSIARLENATEHLAQGLEPDTTYHFRVHALPYNTDPAYSNVAVATTPVWNSATITLGNLIQPYDGAPRAVSVTTAPAGLATRVTYMNPTILTPPVESGAYEVMAYITDPLHTGSATATLIITQLVDAISFAPLGSVQVGSPPLTLHATSTSGLPVAFTSSNLSVATVSGNTLTILGPGLTTITARQDVVSTNYDRAPPVDRVLTVTSATPVATLVFGNLNATYDGSPKPVTITTSPAGLATVITYAGNAAAPANAGSYLVEATITDPLYAGSWSATLVIAKAPQTVSFGPLATKVFGDPAFPVNATSTAGLPVTITSSNPSVATVNGSMVTLVGAGSAILTATQNGDANHLAAAPVSQTLTVAKAGQTITFDVIPTLKCGDPALRLTARASSDLPVTLTTSAPNVAAIVGGDLVALSIGSATVTASQEGNAHYSAAPPVQRTVVVNKGTATVALAGFDQTYDGNPKATGVVSSPPGLTVTTTYNGIHGQPVNAGTYAVVATVTDPNYSGSATGTLRISKAPQSISFQLDPVRVDAGLVLLNATASSGLPVTFVCADASVATVSASTLTLVAPGMTQVTAAQPGNENYLPTTTTRTLIVNGPARMVRNVSARASVSPAQSVIGGFVVGGERPLPVLVRAIGPSLAGYGVTGVLNAPQIDVYAGPTRIAEGRDWGSANNAAEVSAVAARIGAFPLPIGSRDAMLLLTVPPGAYTAVITGVSDAAGATLFEVYDTSPGNGGRLLNVSTRGSVAADAPLIGGFVLSGEGPQRVLMRAVGPALTAFGVRPALARPRLSLYRDNRLIAESDGWNNDSGIARAGAEVGAFPLASGSWDAAVVLNLAPGAYTGVITSADGGSGVALMEMYVLGAAE